MAFVEVMFRAMGFGEYWIHLLLDSIRTVRYLVLINREPSTPIISSRGIRQGDRISPYFLILSMENLSMSLHNAESEVRFHGVSIVRNAPPVSHLLFFDDCFLFCQAKMEEASAILDILTMYEKASNNK